MSLPTDIRAKSAEVYFLPVETRVPLKFGTETLSSVTCARVRMRVEGRAGQTAEGWGETPLSVQWVWPSALPYEERHNALKALTLKLAKAWANFDHQGHPLEIGQAFQTTILPAVLKTFDKSPESASEPVPWLAAIVCCSMFDIAVHDAYGNLLVRPVYETYTDEFLNNDLSTFIEPAPDTDFSFNGLHPSDFLTFPRKNRLPAWHLVGGMDPIEEEGTPTINDGYPVLLRDWIRRDGLTCLKVKLRGNDSDWDLDRLIRIGEIANAEGVISLSADFNCTVEDPEYVNAILDTLATDHPALFKRILYVEQPFPYDLEAHRIDVSSVSKRCPLFLDESAHDWKLIRLGRELGWTGVALKTCKTQTGALLSLCWAKAHNMPLMVQDLTNPMLAQIPHALLAAHADTIMGVETNAMQFYPEASNAEAVIHPGLYTRRDGHIDLSSIAGPGFGYRLNEINRQLPEPAGEF